MTDVGQHSTAGSAAGRREGASRPAGAVRRGALVTTVLSLVTAFTAPVMLAARPAAADQVSDLQTQAAQLAQSILRQQLEIGGLQQQYGAANEQAQAIGGRIDATKAAIGRDQDKIGRDQRDLRSSALFAYMTTGTASSQGAAGVFAPNQRNAQIQGVYEDLVAGNVDVAVDDLHNDQATLGHQQEQLQQEQDAAQAAEHQAADLLGQSEQTQNSLVSQESEVKGQLAEAIAQQEAAREAAAEAAVRAAQEAAAQQQAAQAAAAQRSQVQEAAPASPTTTEPAAQPAAAPTTVTVPAPTSTAPPTVAVPAPTTTTTAPPPVSTTEPAAPVTVPAVTAPPVTVPASSSSGGAPALNSFLQCVVQAESSGNYSVVSPNGQYMGAFQFSQSTWNEAAQLAGMPQLVGVAPNTASAADQDALAIALYSADGQAPWYDPCNTG